LLLLSFRGHQSFLFRNFFPLSVSPPEICTRSFPPRAWPFPFSTNEYFAKMILFLLLFSIRGAKQSPSRVHFPCTSDKSFCNLNCRQVSVPSAPPLFPPQRERFPYRGRGSPEIVRKDLKLSENGFRSPPAISPLPAIDGPIPQPFVGGGWTGHHGGSLMSFFTPFWFPFLSETSRFQGPVFTCPSPNFHLIIDGPLRSFSLSLPFT